MFVFTRFRYIEVLIHIFHYYWGEEYRSLYQGLRYIEVRGIEFSLYHALYTKQGGRNQKSGFVLNNFSRALKMILVRRPLIGPQCSPYQAVTGKIYRLKQHFFPPATA